MKGADGGGAVDRLAKIGKNRRARDAIEPLELPCGGHCSGECTSGTCACTVVLGGEVVDGAEQRQCGKKHGRGDADGNNNGQHLKDTNSAAGSLRRTAIKPDMNARDEFGIVLSSVLTSCTCMITTGDRAGGLEGGTRLGEAVDDPTKRRGVEEGHGRAQHGHQHRLVQVSVGAHG